MDLKEEEAIGGDPSSHWYYISKGRAIKALLDETPVTGILDVGAGSGVFSQMLVGEGAAPAATCVDPNYTDAWLADHKDEKIDYVRGVDAVDASHVLMLDVIEHVDNDVALIKDYADKAAPGTRFLISVPAFNFLWSPHDDFLDHRRRYTEESLVTAVEAAGLEPLRQRYFFGLLFPAVAAMRLADKALKGDREATQSALKAAPDWLNRTLVAVHDVERATLFPFNRIAGVTVFCLARKPRNAFEVAGKAAAA